MSACASCNTKVDDRRPITIRMFVRDASGKEKPLCRRCWSGEGEHASKQERR